MKKKLLIMLVSVIWMITPLACATTLAAENSIRNQPQDARDLLRDNCEPADENGFYLCTREALEYTYNELTNKTYDLDICKIEKNANQRKYDTCKELRNRSLLNNGILWGTLGVLLGVVGGVLITK